MVTPAIEVNAVRKSFRPGALVLKTINLELCPGEMVALIGASGSGKSTLIRVISGLERADRTSGEVRILGDVVQHAGRRTSAQRRLRREIGVIFQQFNLIDRLTLLQNVLVGRLGHVPGWRGTLGLFSRADRIKALESLERVGMVNFAYQRAGDLSGGQQQRGAIARALTQEAKIILADEPIASLDPASAERVMHTLQEINRTDGATVLVSLHQIDFAFRHCQRVVALKDGEIVFNGPTDEILPEDLNSLYGVDPVDPAKELQGSAHAEYVNGAGAGDGFGVPKAIGSARSPRHCR